MLASTTGRRLASSLSTRVSSPLTSDPGAFSDITVLASFNHGSAQAIGIISQFICDQLTNSCKADQTAKDTCKQAQAAGNAAPAKTGAAADAFNAVFGIKTNFAAVQAIDDQGRPVAGTGSDATGNTAAAAATTTAATAATTTAAAAASTTSASSSTGSSSAIGDFGKCSVPKIEFGVGFDNRKETSFQPADKGKPRFSKSTLCRES